MDMRFNLYQRADGTLLAMPVLLLPAAFLEREVEPELVCTVAVEPHMVSDVLVRDIGRDGYAVVQGDDERVFAGLVERHLHERAARRWGGARPDPALACRPA